jgi:hypothetical protein
MGVGVARMGRIWGGLGLSSLWKNYWSFIYKIIIKRAKLQIKYFKTKLYKTVMTVISTKILENKVHNGKNNTNNNKQKTKTNYT